MRLPSTIIQPTLDAVSRAVLLCAVALLLLRLPSLVQPMGADQGAVRLRRRADPATAACRIATPGIRSRRRSTSSTPGCGPCGRATPPSPPPISPPPALVALLLARLGATLGPAAAGHAAALLFLLLSNPALTRLGGIRLRSQCETFIAVAVAGALLLLLRGRKAPSAAAVVSAGVLFGLAFTLKYNAAVFAVAGLAAAWLMQRLTVGLVLRLAAGFARPGRGACLRCSRSAAALRPSVRRDDPLQPAVLGGNLRRAADILPRTC